MVAPLNYTVLLHSRPVGDLERGGRGLRLSFRGEYLDDEARVPLSLSLPAETGLHQGDAVARWIDGLLPGRREVRERWRDHYGAASADELHAAAHRRRRPAGPAVRLLVAAGEGPPARDVAPDGHVGGRRRAAPGRRRRGLTGERPPTRSGYGPGRRRMS